MSTRQENWRKKKEKEKKPQNEFQVEKNTRCHAACSLKTLSYQLAWQTLSPTELYFYHLNFFFFFFCSFSSLLNLPIWNFLNILQQSVLSDLCNFSPFIPPALFASRSPTHQEFCFELQFKVFKVIIVNICIQPAPEPWVYGRKYPQLP